MEKASPASRQNFNRTAVGQSRQDGCEVKMRIADGHETAAAPAERRCPRFEPILSHLTEMDPIQDLSATLAPEVMEY
jgi:hypothetical protein